MRSMMSIERCAIALGVTALAALCLVACGRKEETPKRSTMEEAAQALPPEQQLTVEHDANGEVRYKGQTLTGEKYVGQMGGHVTIPASFPADFPLYPGGVPFAAMEIDDGTTILTLDAPDRAPEVYGFYEDHLPASGWRIDSELNVGGKRVLTAIKGKLKAEIQIEGTEKGARILFQLNPVS
jgi:hypothetical protein